MMLFGRLCLSLVCCAHMAVLLVSCVYIRNDTSSWLAVAFAAAFAQVGLTAIFASLGSWPLIVRLPTWALIGTLPLVMTWIVAVHAHFVEEMPWVLALFVASWVLVFFVVTAIRLLPSVRWHLAYVRGRRGDRPKTNKQFSLLELFMMVAGIAVLLLLVRRLIPPSWEDLWDDLGHPELLTEAMLEGISPIAAATAIQVMAVFLLLGNRRWLPWTGLGICAVAIAPLWIWGPFEPLLFIGTWTTTLVLTLLAARARGIRLIGGRQTTRNVSDEPLSTTRRERFVSLFENPAVLAVLAVASLHAWLDHTGVLTTYQFVLAGHAVQDDHGSIVGLDFEGMEAEEFSLADVGSLHNLAELHLDATRISDSELRHIQGLTNLEKLTLRFTNITDDGLRYLKNLSRLRALDLSGTAISDAGLRHLRTLQELEILGLAETKVTLAGACQLTQQLDSLRRVDLLRFAWRDALVLIWKDCSRHEMRLLGSLDARHLWVYQGNLTQGACEALPSLASVETITLNRVQNADTAVTQMKKMPALRELRLWGEGITDNVLLHVTGVRQLQHLEAWGPDVTSSGYRQLSSLTGLTSLSISGSNVTDDALRDIGRLTRLETLVLTDTAVKDLSPLGELATLKLLDVSGAPVDDLSPLAKLTNLEHLGLRSTSTTDLTPLSNLTSLKSLELSDTAISDLSPLVKLRNLERLELWKTPVADLSPLANLAKLKELNVRDTPVTPQEVAKLRKALPDCPIDGN